MGKSMRRIWAVALMFAITALAGIAVRRTLEWVWWKAKKQEPPEKHPGNYRWRDIAAWTALSGVVTAFSQLPLRSFRFWLEKRMK